MAIEIKLLDGQVLLDYSPYNGTDFISENFDEGTSIFIKKTFELEKNNLLEMSDNQALFVIGKQVGDYFEISNTILGTNFNILFHKDYNISEKDFVVDNNISILKKFEELADQQIIIGGKSSNTIPTNVYREIVDSFPTNTEIKHYKNARITNVISEYLEGVKDSGKAFEDYVNKRDKISLNNNIQSFSGINEYEYEKYSFILMKLEEMLNNSESYSEKQWEREILEIILILFPKYIKSYSSVPLKDYYTNLLMPKSRQIDLVAIDSNNYLDIIEIKKPSNHAIVTKKPYFRDNYTPMKELSGTIMQVEKYIFHLNKWGREGEQKLSELYGEEIRITNPKGFLILGRDNNLSRKQIHDFEIIKRKYSNLIDIITYDDLIRRLKNLLNKFKNP